MSYNLFGWQLFKTEEEKKKEYEGNISTNIAAMEVQNRANRNALTWSNKSSGFRSPTEESRIIDTKNPSINPFSPNYKTYGELSEAERVKDIELGKPGMIERNLGWLINPGDSPYIGGRTDTRPIPQKTDAQIKNLPLQELLAQPWTPNMQTQIDNLTKYGKNLNPTQRAFQAKLESSVGDVYNLGAKSGLKEAATPAAAGKGIDYLSLLKILGMVNSPQATSNVNKGITPGVTPGVAGAKIKEEDLYARYRR